MAGIALGRLANERKQWRREPNSGFVAQPHRRPDGTMHLLMWECGIPGKVGTPWEGATFPIVLHFTEDYPVKPPKCVFPKGFYHVNVYPSGTVCLSILDEKKDWKPSVTIKMVLHGIQQMLDNPNPNSPAQAGAYTDYQYNRPTYDRMVREQSQKYSGQKKDEVDVSWIDAVFDV